MKHPAPVNDRSRQPFVAIVASHEEIECLAGDPALRLHCGQVRPGEWSSAVGLIHSIHTHGIVGASPAKEGSILLAFANVFERSWIHQQRSAVARQTKAQSVRMPMAGCPRTLWASVNHCLLSRFRIGH